MSLGTVALPDRFDHIGVVVKDANKTLKFLSSIWGLGDCPTLEFSPGKDDLIASGPFGAKLIFVNLGSVSLELVEPREGNSIHHRHLEEYGEGVNHVGFNISYWDDTLAKLKEQGSKIVLGGCQ